MKWAIRLMVVMGILSGCTGPEGPIGPQGEQGRQGEQGGQGEQGRQGDQGNRGNTGARGPTGLQGPIGTSTGGALYVATFDSRSDLDTWYKDPSGNGSWSVNAGRLVLAGKSDTQMSVGPEIILAYDNLYAEIKDTHEYSPLRELEIHVQTEWLSGTDTGLYGIILEPVSDPDEPRQPLQVGMYLNGITAGGAAVVYSNWSSSRFDRGGWQSSASISPDSTENRKDTNGDWIGPGIINRKAENVLFYKLYGNKHMFDVCDYCCRSQFSGFPVGWREGDDWYCAADIEDFYNTQDDRLPISYRGTPTSSVSKSYYGLRMRLVVFGLQEVAFDNLYILDKTWTTEPLLKPTTE